jgi:hypothetical protein
LLHYFGISTVTALPDFNEYQNMKDVLFGMGGNSKGADGVVTTDPEL